jgi:DNA-binding response OmpR family regulator
MENPKSTTSEEPKPIGTDLDEFSKLRQCVLIVEDEPDTVFLLKQILLNAGFNVRSALSGEEAIEKVTSHHPDLVLLDLMMPGMNGWETFKTIRQVMDVPVIILSALAIKDDIVKALQLGVDDYITKPFYNAEVVARVKNVLRRTRAKNSNQQVMIPSISLVLDLKERTTKLQGQTIDLSPREYAIFSLLVTQAPSTVKYAEISQAVWGEDSADARKRTKFLVYLIRKKLQAILPGVEIIRNITQIGYKINSVDS